MGRGVNIGFIGAPGTGKTHAARTLARSKARAVLIDPTGTATDTFTVHDGRETIAVLQEYSAPSIVLRCGHLQRQAIQTETELVLLYCERQRFSGGVTIIVDEFGVFSANGSPTTNMERALRQGRHTGVCVWPVSQRAIDFGPDVRQGLEVIYVFRQIELRDIKHLNELAPVKDGRKLGDVAQHLADRHFIRYDRRDGQWQTHGPLGKQAK